MKPLKRNPFQLAGLAVAVLCVCGCASKAAGPKPIPNTAAGGLKSIAYLPYIGPSVDITEQQLRAKDWSEWWREVYPDTRWLLSQEAAALITSAQLADSWLGAEKTYLQLGSLPAPLVRQLCEATKTDGILQMAVTGVQAGGVISTWFRPWFLQSGGVPSTARMSGALYRCSDLVMLWQKSADLSYQANYTHSQMVDYVQRALASSIPQ